MNLQPGAGPLVAAARPIPIPKLGISASKYSFARAQFRARRVQHRRLHFNRPLEDRHCGARVTASARKLHAPVLLFQLHPPRIPGEYDGWQVIQLCIDNRNHGAQKLLNRRHARDAGVPLLPLRPYMLLTACTSNKEGGACRRFREGSRSDHPALLDPSQRNTGHHQTNNHHKRRRCHGNPSEEAAARVPRSLRNQVLRVQHQDTDDYQHQG